MRSAAVLGILGCVIGCGSGSGSDSDKPTTGEACGFVACGGDLRGTWQIASTCLTKATVPISACSDNPTLSLANVHESGSLTFNSDGTFESDSSFSYDELRSWPESCLIEAGTSCAITQEQSRLCKMSGSDCLCRGSYTSPYSQSGTYTVSGSSVTFVAYNRVGPPIEYCVQGSALYLRTLTLSALASTATPTFFADIALTR